MRMLLLPLLSVLLSAPAFAVSITSLGTLDSQIPATGTQTISGNNTFAVSLEMDFQTLEVRYLALFSRDGYTTTSSQGPAVTFLPGSSWSWWDGFDGGIAPTLTANESGVIATYSWGIDAVNSDGAGVFEGPPPICSGHAFCSFALSASPAWDLATLTIYLNHGLSQIYRIELTTTEVAVHGDTTSYYTLATPLPAAAWLFGSGLIGLAGLRPGGTRAGLRGMA